ncbi:MAG: hypothetical protein ACI8SK_000909 [Shewanella sp.]|jgi:hypothetical protein
MSIIVDTTNCSVGVLAPTSFCAKRATSIFKIEAINPTPKDM